jgi:hypothetical protein
MRSILRAATAIFAFTFLFNAGLANAHDYEPEIVDAVVVYIHKFKADEFNSAKKLIVEGFWKAISASGQTRRSFLIANPETHEIIGISFFEKGHSVDEWHANDARGLVLNQLEPLRSAPLTHQRYEVIGTHNVGD